MRSSAADRRLAPKILEDFVSVPTANISDNLSRLVGARGLTRYNKEGTLAGTALTVKTRPGDNLYVYKALTMLERGDVLVVDAQGDTTNAILGELIKMYALSRGCVGFVVDGAIRDVAAFATTPCYARGISHRGPYKSGPGEINVPISIGGMVVQPGDVLVGDEDGIVAIPPSQAEEVLAAAAATLAKEEAVRQEIASGRPDQEWLHGILRVEGLA